MPEDSSPKYYRNKKEKLQKKKVWEKYQGLSKEKKKQKKTTKKKTTTRWAKII